MNCKHDLLIEWCAICKPLPPPDPFSAPAATHSRVFPAAFDSECGNCGADIYQGDQIAHHEEHGYVHEECLED